MGSIPKAERYHANQLRDLFTDRVFTGIFSRLNVKARKLSEVVLLKKALATYVKFEEERKRYGYEEIRLRVTGIYNWLSQK